MVTYLIANGKDFVVVKSTLEMGVIKVRADSQSLASCNSYNATQISSPKLCTNSCYQK